MPSLALALVLTSFPAGAEVAPDDRWRLLDEEITNLAEGLGGEASGTRFIGFLRSEYVYGGDNITVDGVRDPSGFEVLNARVGFEGEAGDYLWRVSMDLDDDDEYVVADAFARFPIGGNVSATLGQFKEPFLHGGIVSRNALLFLDRSFNAEQHDDRDVGFMLHGSSGFLDWYAAAQNGQDGKADEYQLTGRVVFNFVGDAFQAAQGALRSEQDDTNLSVGFAGADDGAITDGTRFGVDLGLVAGPFSVYADLVSYDENYDPAGLDPDQLTGESKADTSPYSVMLGYLWPDSNYELAFRFEDLDDDVPGDTERWAVALNWYGESRTHRRKWQIVYVDQDSDDDEIEGRLVRVGLTLGGADDVHVTP